MTCGAFADNDVARLRFAFAVLSVGGLSDIADDIADECFTNGAR